MIRYLYLFLILPFSLAAALTFNTNYTRNINILKAFNILPSFLYDMQLKSMEQMEQKRYQSKHFFQAMNDAYIFIPRIKEILSQYNIPPEFLYLAMAESNFSTNADSDKRAVGMWQFMPQTAKLFHLKVNRYVDERRDLIASTKAAAKYLLDLHKRFGKWYLAAIAYNCGGGCLSHAIRRAGTDKLSVLLNPKRHLLPLESRLYIRKILALAIVGSDEHHLLHHEYDFLLDRGNAYSLATVHVGPGASLVRISRVLGIPLSELRKLNRNLNYNFTPPYVSSYHIYIPYIKLATFKKKYHPARYRHIYEVHLVKNGDTLYKLQQKYHVSYDVIKAFNNLHGNVLSLGQRLIIPIAVRHDYMPIKPRYDIVKAGDTLGLIAQRNHMGISLLKHENHLTNNIIQIGQKLTVNRIYSQVNNSNHVHLRTTHRQKGPKYDIVKRGDTLRLIAQRNHISISLLRRENHLTGSLIRVGQKLAIR